MRQVQFGLGVAKGRKDEDIQSFYRWRSGWGRQPPVQNCDILRFQNGKDMDTIIHLLDVGQGNMTLIECADGSKRIFDCNLTSERENSILQYLANQINWDTPIDAFYCSHRDADHMRGIVALHRYFPIKKVIDTGYVGTTTDSTEYREYMRLRNNIGNEVQKRKQFIDFGQTRFRFMSDADERLAENANAQGLVLKVEHRDISKLAVRASAILTGDSDAQTWRNAILKDYTQKDISTDILVAGHHGSLSFFDDPADAQNYYTQHMQQMNPAMALISVGPNAHGHPDEQAVEFYERYCRGSKQGNKVFRTDHKGHIKLTLKDSGGWSLNATR
jgi:beta-lactamase superfamily II metal-dependent hydrolase